VEDFMAANYSGFAYIYDALMQDMDYDRWVEYLNEIFKRFGVKPELVLELACGTGNICIRLAKQGYDMIGLDSSEDMLNVAVQKSKDSGLDILFLHQDMREFELYGTVDAILCMLDSINYITDPNDLKKVFKLVNNYLNPGGLFIFDINSKYKLSTILGNNTFSVDENDIFYVWENNYEEKNQICNFYLTFFVKEGSKYDRIDEIHQERAYIISEIKQYLEHAGLQCLGVFDQLTFAEPADDSERIFFIAQRKD